MICNLKRANSNCILPPAPPTVRVQIFAGRLPHTDLEFHGQVKQPQPGERNGRAGGVAGWRNGMCVFLLAPDAWHGGWAAV